MADRYWVGGTNTWNATVGTKWATTSGGAGGAAVPTAADDVFFDAASGVSTITLSTNDVCRSINCTGFTGTLSHGASVDLFIGDATAGAGNIALKFVAGMTYTLGSGTTSTVSFQSTSATVQTVDYGGKTCGLTTFGTAASGGSWQLTSAMTSNTGSTIGLSRGTLDTNNQTCSWGFFSSTSSNTRALTLGSSSITLTGGSGTHWTTSTTTGMTFTPGTSTITFSYTSTCAAAFGSLTYNNIVFNYLMGIGLNISGAFTCANLTFTGTTGITTNASEPNFAANFTVTGTLTMTGLSSGVRLGCRSNTDGTPRTITAAAVSLTNVDFRDITAAGATIPWTGTSLGDVGGNSNITFTPATTRYAVATGNWNTTAVWSASSGGASGASIPLAQDDVFLNAASGAITVTQTLFYMGKNINFTGFTGTFAGSTATNVLGDFILSAGTTVTSTSSFTFRGRGTHVITSAGKSFGSTITMASVGGSYTMQDDLTAASSLTIVAGTFNTANFTLTIFSMTATSTATNATISFGTSIVNLTRTDATNILDIRGTVNYTWDIASSTFVISTASVNQRVINASLGSIVFGNITYTVAGSAGRLVIQGASHSFNNITFSDATTARSLRFSISNTFTIRGNFAVSGSAGIVHTLESSVSGTPFILSKSSDSVSCDYLSIQDSTATGGAAWYAGANSTNVSGNTGWIFTAPPVAGISKGGTYLLMGV